MTTTLSIVIPAKNEAENLLNLLPKLVAAAPDAEIIVVDDGSSDDVISVCETNNVKVLSHPYSMGNGAAVKTGARVASGDTIIFMDGDGQHRPEDLVNLLSALEPGYDMVIGTRDAVSHASRTRWFANHFYNRLASAITNHRIEDLTSGFRAVRADKFREFLDILPNGFSYPTTITMAFLRSGYSVGYVAVTLNKRIGKSHINLTKDGLRFLLIIFKVGTLYSPLKVFAPISAVFFATGVSYYIYTYVTQGRFSRMSALILATSVLIFLIGLISEQITALLFALSRKSDGERK